MLRLQVHAAQQVCEARVRAQWIKQLISCRLRAQLRWTQRSSNNPLANSVDLYSEAYVDPAQLVEGAAECDSGELCWC
jgi:hypothetical protein